MTEFKIKEPDFVYRNNEPVAVMLDIETYNEIIERLEDYEDIQALKHMREQPLNTRKFSEFIADNNKDA